MVEPCTIKMKKIEITICEPCLDGEGEMCTTPGCAFWLHLVDLPVDPSAYVVKSISQEPADA